MSQIEALYSSRRRDRYRVSIEEQEEILHSFRNKLTEVNSEVTCLVIKQHEKTQKLITVRT